MASFLSDIELLEPLGKSFNQKGALKDWSGGPIKPETPMEPKTIKARPTPKVQAPQAAPAPDTSSMALDKTRRETFGQIAKRVGGRKAALQLLTRAASKLIPAAGAADIGYTIGTMLDQATGASDKISDLLAFGQVRDRDDSGAANVYTREGLDSVTQQNKNLPWVKRKLDGNKLSIEGDGYHETHRLAAEVTDDGEWIVFPTIVEKDGQLKRMELREAQKHAIKTNTAMRFGKNKDLALAYSENGLIDHAQPTTSKASQRITQEVFDSLPSQIEQGLDQELSQFKGYSPFNR